MKDFSELNLSAPLKQAVAEMGFTAPTPIQAAALPILLGEATDFLGLAATGTGKTATFSLPLLERLDSATRAVQGLVLCPTRELAVQVCGQINLMGKQLGVRALPVYGGASYNDQISGLRRGAAVVVGTPGRVVDLIERGVLDLSEIHTVVLDEADKMISMGFKEELEKILEQAPRESSNIWLFSATMSREVRKVADQYLRSPKQVQVNQNEMLSSTVEQSYYATQESNKPEVLCKLIDVADGFFGLVFCQTKSLVTDLTRYMQERGYRVDCLHGDMDQNSRTRVMQAFRDRKVTVLICTDVASRGLDVQGITHVINYSIPRELDHYVHRIGRTARSGKTGFAISLVTPSHRILLRRIEQMTKSRIVEGKIPGRREIGAKKVAGVLKDFEAQKGAARAIEVMDEAWKERIAGMSADEVAGRFLSMMFPDVFAEREQEVPTVKPRVNPGVIVNPVGRGAPVVLPVARVSPGVPGISVRPGVTVTPVVRVNPVRVQPVQNRSWPAPVTPRASSVSPHSFSASIPKPLAEPRARFVPPPRSMTIPRPKAVGGNEDSNRHERGGHEPPRRISADAPPRRESTAKETRRERRAKLFGPPGSNPKHQKLPQDAGVR